jgi:hypothetical protein
MDTARLVKPKKITLKLRRFPAPQRERHKAEEQFLAPISADSRMFVWLRDGGKCRRCGSTRDLQFDHIIPRSWGGAGTAANVELLCAKCNRRKGAGL